MESERWARYLGVSAYRIAGDEKYERRCDEQQPENEIPVGVIHGSTSRAKARNASATTVRTVLV